jgi:twitching motility protein PilT
MGMQTLDQSLAELVRSHKVTREEALSKVQNKDSFMTQG